MVGQHPDGNLFKTLTPEGDECQIDNGKKDGSTIGRKLPMFYPNETFTYLMDVGLDIDMNAVQTYWNHLIFGKSLQKM